MPVSEFPVKILKMSENGMFMLPKAKSTMKSKIHKNARKVNNMKFLDFKIIGILL